MFYKLKFKRWLKKATLDELNNGYEKFRQDWVSKGCHGEMYPEMKAINKRVTEIMYGKTKVEKNHNKRWTDEARWDK